MLNSLRSNWNGLAPLQRAALVAILVAVFGGILMLAVTTGRPSYAVLFSELPPEEAGAIISKLKDLKVDHKLTNGGQTIEVPADRRDELRISLASEGLLPTGGGAGLEIFDKPSFGTTEFVQHLNFQRAQQGELSRTIQKIDGVLEARVHLAIPEKALFSQKEQPVKASVMLKLRPNFRLDTKKINGITALVSAAIERLEPENVTISDDQGNQLNIAEGSSDLTGGQIELQARHERRLTEDLQQLANRVLGPNKAAVRVSVDMDWDQTQSTSETYRPSGNRGENLPIEERTNVEGYRKSTAPAAAPGTLNNTAPVVNPLNPGDFNNSQINRTYVVDKSVKTSTVAPGKIRRLSVAVFVDSKIDSAQLLSLRNTLAASVGLDLTPTTAGGRGDKIELMPITFDTSEQDRYKSEELAASKAAAQANLVRNGAALGTLVLIGVFTLLMTRKSTKKPRRQRLDATIGAAEPPALAGSTPEAGAAGGSLDPRNLLEEGPDAPQEDELMTTLGRLRRTAAEQPEEVALMLQDWLRGPSKPVR